jgi:hypothetical protein
LGQPSGHSNQTIRRYLIILALHATPVAFGGFDYIVTAAVARKIVTNVTVRKMNLLFWATRRSGRQSGQRKRRHKANASFSATGRAGPYCRATKRLVSCQIGWARSAAGISDSHRRAGGSVAARWDQQRRGELGRCLLRRRWLPQAARRGLQTAVSNLHPI